MKSVCTCVCPKCINARMCVDVCVCLHVGEKCARVSVRVGVWCVCARVGQRGIHVCEWVWGVKSRALVIMLCVAILLHAIGENCVCLCVCP